MNPESNGSGQYAFCFPAAAAAATPADIVKFLNLHCETDEDDGDRRESRSPDFSLGSSVVSWEDGCTQELLGAVENLEDATRDQVLTSSVSGIPQPKVVLYSKVLPGTFVGSSEVILISFSTCPLMATFCFCALCRIRSKSIC